MKKEFKTLRARRESEKKNQTRPTIPERNKVLSFQIAKKGLKIPENIHISACEETVGKISIAWRGGKQGKQGNPWYNIKRPNTIRNHTGQNHREKKQLATFKPSKRPQKQKNSWNRTGLEI